MMERVFAQAALREVHADQFRNIVSLRVSQDLFDDLSDDPAAWQAAIQLELATKPPLFASPTPVIHRPFEEAHWNDAIGYPFTHWQRSRYSDGRFGVWYGADSIETTVHETLHHWRAQLLGDAGFSQAGIVGERRLYRVRCDATLIDLRPAVPSVPALVDPADYGLTQQIGAKLHREGHPGLTSKSARCKGDILAILNAQVLSNPRPFCHLTYRTTATGVVVEREAGKVWMRV